MLPTLHLEIERWKYNKEYNVYVSSFGNIKNENKKLIEKNLNQSGYFVVYVGNKLKSVHRLVAETWLGKSELTVDHKDSNRRNNKLSNLEYVTEEENLERAKDKMIVEEVNVIMDDGKIIKPNKKFKLPENSKIFASRIEDKSGKVSSYSFESYEEATMWIKNNADKRKFKNYSFEAISSIIKGSIVSKSIFNNMSWEIREN